MLRFCQRREWNLRFLATFIVLESERFHFPFSPANFRISSRLSNASVHSSRSFRHIQGRGKPPSCKRQTRCGETTAEAFCVRYRESFVGSRVGRGDWRTIWTNSGALPAKWTTGLSPSRKHPRSGHAFRHWGKFGSGSLKRRDPRGRIATPIGQEFEKGRGGAASIWSALSESCFLRTRLVSLPKRIYRTRCGKNSCRSAKPLEKWKICASTIVDICMRARIKETNMVNAIAKAIRHPAAARLGNVQMRSRPCKDQSGTLVHSYVQRHQACSLFVPEV